MIDIFAGDADAAGPGTTLCKPLHGNSTSLVVMVEPWAGCGRLFCTARVIVLHSEQLGEARCQELE